MFLYSVFHFLIAISILVAIHELGHYLAARWCGVKVIRFSLGMGKVLWSRKFGKDQTEWAISMLPIGGYVSMLDGRSMSAEELSGHDLSREFTRQSVWKRMLIVAAGPAANFLLAILLFTGLFFSGTTEPVPRIALTSETGVAAAAGFKTGDIIRSVDGRELHGWSQLADAIVSAALERRAIDFEVESESQVRRSVSVPAGAFKLEDLEKDFSQATGMTLAKPAAVIHEVMPDGPAAKSGLLAGDRIQFIDGKAVPDVTVFVDLIGRSAGQKLEIGILRNGQALVLSATPAEEERNGKLVGKLHVALEPPEMTIVRFGAFESLLRGVSKTWEGSILNLKLLWKIVTGEASIKNVTGPVTIAEYAGKAAKVGIESFISLLAAISIGLGVMNLLPVPVLDGGYLLYYSLEILRGKALSDLTTQRLQQVGIALLVMLMALAFFNDIARQYVKIAG